MRQGKCDLVADFDQGEMTGTLDSSILTQKNLIARIVTKDCGWSVLDREVITQYYGPE